MKKLSVLILVAILGAALLALPAGAEKIRLTDAEMDGITAGILPGVSLIAPPMTSPVWKCCARVGLEAFGGLMPLTGNVHLGVSTIPINPTISSGVSLNATGLVPGGFGTNGFVFGPNGLLVTLPPFSIPIP